MRLEELQNRLVQILYDKDTDVSLQEFKEFLKNSKHVDLESFISRLALNSP